MMGTRRHDERTERRREVSRQAREALGAPESPLPTTDLERLKEMLCEPRTLRVLGCALLAAFVVSLLPEPTRYVGSTLILDPQPAWQTAFDWAGCFAVLLALAEGARAVLNAEPRGTQAPVRAPQLVSSAG